MQLINVRLTLIFLFFILPGIALCQKELITVSSAQGSVKVDPSLLKRASLKASGHDGKEHIYTGVLLSDVLEKAGIVLGNKRESINSYIITRAKDNYTTIFSLAEIDPLFAKADILVADKIDDKTLSPSAAPFQLIVPADKVQTRWIRQLVSVEVVRIK